MRVLACRPGPNFSVADVHRGWVRALRRLGCQVVDFPYDDVMQWNQRAWRGFGDDETTADTKSLWAASKNLEAALYEVWPDVLLITMGSYVPPPVWELARIRGHRVVLVATEAPYEDDKQIGMAALCDVVCLNDPTHLDRFCEVTPTIYTPAAYDPAVHCPGPSDPELTSEFAFVGTGYPSRIGFFEQVDWSGIDATFAGNWTKLDGSSPLRKLLAHDEGFCVDNDDTVRMYRSTKVSANLYRRESDAGLTGGWAMGPREVELAATGTFFLRETRPEGDDVLHMLPVVDGPDDFAAQLRWWLDHPYERQLAARLAREAVAPRTFESNARALLNLLG